MKSSKYPIERNSKILLVGAQGMVGSAIARLLHKLDYINVLTPGRQQIDLINQAAVDSYLKQHRPEIIIIAAAKVGGIYANSTYRSEFLYDNLMIASNLIHGAYENKIERLLFLGSSCIYPKNSPQPLKEDYLLKGPFEPTNEAYGLAKVAGLKMCQYYFEQYGCKYVSAMPTNLYGFGDNYHAENSHVLPALIRRFHEAKLNKLPEVTLWGTGKVYREFLNVDDLADACLFLLENYQEPTTINVGTEDEFTIKDLAHMVKEIVGYEGVIVHDLSKPDGMERKKLDTTRIEKLGWKAKISLREGLEMTYKDFVTRYPNLRGIALN
ncbi:MAG: GDP-L-fucose synthase [Chlamydiales bacterium]|jgi:GDP-L-fucose synthase|nr:GDP-L-fucose synthase [Chlamydiales bacterium]